MPLNKLPMTHQTEIQLPPTDALRGPLSAVLARLGASEDGLTRGEAARRADVHGPNLIEDARRSRWLGALLARFRNPLVLILLFAAAVSAATRDPQSFVIITTIVVVSILIDFLQERRADTAAAMLRDRVALQVRALRDGVETDIPAAALVPGDVVLLSAGCLVPADCRLIAARDLFVNEALLTGETYPAEKSADGPGDDDTSAVFMRSSVVSGTAKALVVATGADTRIGAIAQSLQQEPPPTAFAVGLRDFSLMIVRLTVLLVLFVLLVNLLFHRPLLDSFLFAMALAVGLTPELLPMIVSVTLAHGAIRMSRKDVIVKHLPAIHDLGSMDVLCSDKTGTLTEARIRLVREIDIRGADSTSVLEWAHVNAAFETGLKSPLDDAILDRAPADLGAWKKIDEVPFDFERRRVSVLAERAGRRFLVLKGAPEDVLDLCARYQSGPETEAEPFDATTRALARATFEQLGAAGFRVLGVAWREVAPDIGHAGKADEADLTFAGFAAFLDPPKESARAALAALRQLGVAIRVVTGDNERVTQHVCEELGITIKGILTGPELDTLSDEALSARLAQVTLFCRVNPAQKARIIRALRRRGHVVGYLGDGINDAPSLRAADVGMSVEGAVDVAREAAAIILLRNDLGVLAEGVREGRRTFANILKYVMMGTSSSFGNMFSMAGAVVILPFLPMVPVQILLNNLIYYISEITIPLDRVDEVMIARPRHWDLRFVRNFMLVFGSASSAFDYLTFGLLIWVFHGGEAIFQTGWFVESLATQTLVIFVIRTRGQPFRSRPHPLLTATTLAAVAVGVGLPYSPFGAWFGFVPLPGHMVLALAGMTAAYLLLTQGLKTWFYRHFAPAGETHKSLRPPLEGRQGMGHEQMDPRRAAGGRPIDAHQGQQTGEHLFSPGPRKRKDQE